MAIPMIPGIIGLLAALTGAGATNFAMGARPASTIGGPNGQGASPQPAAAYIPTSPTVRRATTAPANIRARGGGRGVTPQPAATDIPIYGSRNPDTPYAAINAMFGEPKATPRPASKPAAKSPAKQGAKAPAPAAQQKLATASPMAQPVQEDPFTQSQRMVNGTEQVPAEVMAPVSDPVEDRYQLLLKMYGITPDNTAAPNGMPDTMARQAGLNTGATSGVFNPEAALQYYGGDQAVYDALARMYGW